MTITDAPPATAIRAQIDPAAIRRVSSFFDAGIDDILRELLQNARRSGATLVSIEHDGKTVRVEDNGRGIADPQSLLSFGRTDWPDPTTSAEHPAGMGIYALARCERVTITSRARDQEAWSVTLEPSHFVGIGDAPVTPKPDCPHHTGTTVEFQWDDDIRQHVQDAALHFTVPVTYLGEPVKQQHFLHDAIHITEWLTAGYNGDEIEVALAEIFDLVKEASPEDLDFIQQEVGQIFDDAMEQFNARSVSPAAAESFHDYCVAMGGNGAILGMRSSLLGQLKGMNDGRFVEASAHGWAEDVRRALAWAYVDYDLEQPALDVHDVRGAMSWAILQNDGQRAFAQGGYAVTHYLGYEMRAGTGAIEAMSDDDDFKETLGNVFDVVHVELCERFSRDAAGRAFDLREKQDQYFEKWNAEYGKVWPEERDPVKEAEREADWVKIHDDVLIKYPLSATQAGEINQALERFAAGGYGQLGEAVADVPSTLTYDVEQMPDYLASVRSFLEEHEIDASAKVLVDAMMDAIQKTYSSAYLRERNREKLDDMMYDLQDVLRRC